MIAITLQELDAILDAMDQDREMDLAAMADVSHEPDSFDYIDEGE